MESSRSFLKKIAHVLFSNMLSIVAGVLIGFFIPKIMPIIDYSYYKIYTLYISYVGLFTIGIAEGVYLKYAGKDEDAINIKKIRSLTVFFLALQALLTIVGIAISLMVNGDYSLVFVFVFSYLFLSNICTYFQNLSQSFSRFKEYSILNSIRSILSILSVITFFFIYRSTNALSYWLFLISVMFVNLAMFIAYIIRYRNFIIGESLPLKEIKSDIWAIVKLGIPLLICDFVGSIILNVDRQVVSIFYDKETYAYYAFAYNIINLVIVAIGSVSVVLYPTLKKYNEESQKGLFDSIFSLVTLVACGSLFLFYPLTLFVKFFLPNYRESIQYVEIIFPSLIFSSLITIVLKNYFKSLNSLTLFSIIAGAILILAIGLDLIGVYVTQSILFISYASIIAMSVWFIVLTIVLRRKMEFHFVKNYLVIVISIALFYLTNYFIDNVYICMGIFFGFLIVLFVVYFNTIKLFFKKKTT